MTSQFEVIAFLFLIKDAYFGFFKILKITVYDNAANQ